MNPEVDREERMNVMKAKQGDRGAFEFLVRRYHPSIYRLCFAMTGAHQTADDLSQETFVKAFFSFNGFEPERNFYFWIRRIAVNTALNALRIRRREVSLDERLPWRAGGDGPQQILEKKERFRNFLAALRSLPGDQKAIFYLRVGENLSYQEISETLDIPIGTVMSRLNRARKKLAKRMGTAAEGDGL